MKHANTIRQTQTHKTWVNPQLSFTRLHQKRVSPESVLEATHGAANVNVNVNLHSLALTQLFPRVRMPELLRGHQEVTTDILH